MLGEFLISMAIGVGLIFFATLAAAVHVTIITAAVFVGCCFVGASLAILTYLLAREALAWSWQRARAAVRRR